MATQVNADYKDRASKTLAIMLDYLGLEADLKASEKGAKIALTVSSQDAGRIIGRKGQTLEDLQLLLNRMMFKSDDTFPRIIIDIDGYSRESNNRRQGGGSRNQRRDPEAETALRQRALDAAKEVKRWGESVTLPEMSARERRIIHITLKDDDSVHTESIGNGPRKSVCISLSKED